MPRPPTQPDRDTLDELEQRAYDVVVRRFQRARSDRPEDVASKTDAGGWGPVLNAPIPAAWQNELAKYFRTRGEVDGSYSHADRELATIVGGFEFDAAELFMVNISDAPAVGVRIEAIRAIWEGRDDALTDDERLLVTFVREVSHGTLSDEIYDAMERRLGARGLVELTMFVNFEVSIIRTAQALHTYERRAPEQVDHELDELLKGLADGTIPPGDPHIRIQQSDLGLYLQEACMDVPLHER
jgi:hypothetical protein